MHLKDLPWIKNIIFDLGGVLINIDYKATENAFKNAGIRNFDELFSQAKQTQLFDNLEKGLVDEVTFKDSLRLLSNVNLSDKAIDDAWNAMLLDFPKHRVELLQKLKKNYKTFLLSNTNELHIPTFENLIEKEYGITDFSSLFNKLYYSCRVKMRKPDKEIFELVIQENNLNPNETLFIDDSIQHVQGAKNMGLNAIHLQQIDVSSLFEN
ncbi:MAG: HAD family hydrolase [Bacteroidia bacterium]